MTLRHLKIFVAVCKEGGITAAAQKLRMSQPAASLAVSELENYYGVKLFDRISRRLHITETGKHFLQYALHISSLFEQMETGMKNWDNIGVLRIGASITIGNYLLPGFVEEFNERFPQISVNVIIDNSERVEDYVLGNSVDFALIEGIPRSPHITSRSFMEDELVLVCSTAHPYAKLRGVELEELVHQPLILREKGSAGREIFDSIMQLHDMQMTPAWQSVSTQAIIRAVSKGIGISVLPYLLVKNDLDQGNLAKMNINGVSLKRKFYIIHHNDKFITTAMNEFMQICLMCTPLQSHESIAPPTID